LDSCNSPSSSDIPQTASGLKTTIPSLRNSTVVQKNLPELMVSLRSTTPNRWSEPTPNPKPVPSTRFSQISAAQSTSQLNLCNSISTSEILQSTSFSKATSLAIQNSIRVTEISSESIADVRTLNCNRPWEPTPSIPNPKLSRPISVIIEPHSTSPIQSGIEPIPIYRSASLSQLLDSPEIFDHLGDDENSPKSNVCLRSTYRWSKQPPQPKPKPSETILQVSATQSTSQLDLCTSPFSFDILQSTSGLKPTTPFLRNSTDVSENLPESNVSLKSTRLNRRSEPPPNQKPKPSTRFSQISAAQPTSQLDIFKSPSSSDLLQSTSTLKTTISFYPNPSENSPESNHCLKSTNTRSKQPPMPKPKPSKTISKISATQWTSQLDLCNLSSSFDIHQSTSDLKTTIPLVRNSTDVGKYLPKSMVSFSSTRPNWWSEPPPNLTPRPSTRFSQISAAQSTSQLDSCNSISTSQILQSTAILKAITPVIQKSTRVTENFSESIAEFRSINFNRPWESTPSTPNPKPSRSISEILEPQSTFPIQSGTEPTPIYRSASLSQLLDSPEIFNHLGDDENSSKSNVCLRSTYRWSKQPPKPKPKPSKIISQVSATQSTSQLDLSASPFSFDVFQSTSGLKPTIPFLRNSTDVSENLPESNVPLRSTRPNRRSELPRNPNPKPSSRFSQISAEQSTSLLDMFNSPSFSDLLQSTSTLKTITPFYQNPNGASKNSPESNHCLRSTNTRSEQPLMPKPKPSKTISQISATQSTSQLDLFNSPSSSDILQSTSGLKTTIPFFRNSTGGSENLPKSIVSLRSTRPNRWSEPPPNLKPRPSTKFSQISAPQSISQLDSCNSISTAEILQSTSIFKATTLAIQNSTRIIENSSESIADVQTPNCNRLYEPTLSMPNPKSLRPISEIFEPQSTSPILLNIEPTPIYRSASLSQLLDSPEIFDHLGDDKISPKSNVFLRSTCRWSEQPPKLKSKPSKTILQISATQSTLQLDSCTSPFTSDILQITSGLKPTTLALNPIQKSTGVIESLPESNVSSKNTRPIRWSEPPSNPKPKPSTRFSQISASKWTASLDLCNSPSSSDFFQSSSTLKTTTPFFQNPNGVGLSKNSPEWNVCLTSTNRRSKKPPMPKPKPSKTISQISGAKSTSKLDLCNSPSSSDIIQSTSGLKKNTPFLQNSTGVKENLPESIVSLRSTSPNRLAAPPRNPKPKPFTKMSEISAPQSISQLDSCSAISTSEILQSTSIFKATIPVFQNSARVPENSAESIADFRILNFNGQWELTLSKPNAQPSRQISEIFDLQSTSHIQSGIEPTPIYRSASLSELLDSPRIFDHLEDDDNCEKGISDFERTTSMVDLSYHRRVQERLLEIKLCESHTKLTKAQTTLAMFQATQDAKVQLDQPKSESKASTKKCLQLLGFFRKFREYLRALLCIYITFFFL